MEPATILMEVTMFGLLVTAFWTHWLCTRYIDMWGHELKNFDLSIMFFLKIFMIVLMIITVCAMIYVGAQP